MVGEASTACPTAVRLVASMWIAVALSTAVAVAQPATIDGVVVDGDGRPLEGVTVVLRDPGEPEPIVRRITNAEGGFEIDAQKLRPGREMTLSRNGFADVVVAITPRHLVVSTIELTMRRTVTVDPDDPLPAVPEERTSDPFQPVPDDRKRAIRIYNDAVKQFEKATKEKVDEDKEEAIQMLRESASIDPTFAEPHRLLARLALKQQNYAEAARYSEDLIRIDPNDTEAIRVLYLGMVVTRNHFRVGDAARRLAAVDPGAIDSIDEHARTFYENGIYVMSRALYEVLAEVSDDRLTATLNLGICCVALGDGECGRAAFERFLELAPDDHPDLEMVREELAGLE